MSAFLDHETAKIDALIEKQQRLIELLKEKRQETPVFLPPLAEQAAVVAYITAEAEKFDVPCAQALLSKELLQERRTALISAAVTGKVDVRDWQPAAAQEEVGIEC